MTFSYCKFSNLFTWQLPYQADGKLRVRELQTAGPQHLYNCTVCETLKSTPAEMGTLRTISGMTAQSTRALWNPKKRNMSDLYHESKGELL